VAQSSVLAIASCSKNTFELPFLAFVQMYPGPYQAEKRKEWRLHRQGSSNIGTK